jgi:hypothetical protein
MWPSKASAFASQELHLSAAWAAAVLNTVSRQIFIVMLINLFTLAALLDGFIH